MTIEIKGMKELNEKFDLLKTAPDARKMRKVILDSAEMIMYQVRDNIRRMVRKRTGLLAQSPIARGIKKGRRKGRNEAFVRIDRYLKGTYKGEDVIPNKYAHLVEYGTWGKYGKGVGFFRNAVDKTLPRAERTIKIGLEKVLREIERRG
ncbi:MAG: HK97 gp10 family phage protein [Magnetococcus sp. WYHC-3]